MLYYASIGQCWKVATDLSLILNLQLQSWCFLKDNTIPNRDYVFTFVKTNSAICFIYFFYKIDNKILWLTKKFWFSLIKKKKEKKTRKQIQKIWVTIIVAISDSTQQTMQKKGAERTVGGSVALVIFSMVQI